MIKTFSSNSDRIQYLQQQTNYKVNKTKPVTNQYPSYDFKLSLLNGYKKCNCFIRY
jgi:hypothetical protein